MKDLPCGIIRIAKLRWPSKESKSLLEKDADFLAFLITSLMQFIFSDGREACIKLESNVMPKNPMALRGPSVFSSERGTPKSLKVHFSAEMQRSGLTCG